MRPFVVLLSLVALPCARGLVCGAWRGPLVHRARPLLIQRGKVVRERGERERKSYVKSLGGSTLSLSPLSSSLSASVEATQRSECAHTPRPNDSLSLVASRRPGDSKPPTRRRSALASLSSPASFSSLSSLSASSSSCAAPFSLLLGLLAAKPLPALAEVSPWPYSTLIEQIDKGGVQSVTLSSDGKLASVMDKKGQRHETQLIDSVDIVERLQRNKVVFELAPEKRESSTMVGNLLGSILPPIVLIGGLLFLTSRGDDRTESANRGRGGPMAFAKSKDVSLEPSTGVTFADVAGCDASKLELEEVVDFLKNPAKYSALGAKVPRGVLMEGPPGTGKTLLARAVAGEAGVPFISASGSEFIEMFVGVGASRVRDLFGKAKKNAPCIIFIDEIDAVARTRPGAGGGMGGGSDEREQTLNQILTEMDGFDGNAGVIVIAATNRADILDPALLRPGRFDRRVPVELPDRKGREAILKVHARDKPLGPDVSLAEIAARTTGLSGASLRNLLNEAAIVAARRSKSAIGYDEIDYAIDRIQVGLQRIKERGPIAASQRLVAYHEAGHALMALLTPGFDAVTKVTIIPRSNGAGGFTIFTPDDEQLESGLYSKRYLLNQIAVALGGRVAEEIVFGEEEVTTGASNDLQQVYSIAHRMVSQWGFTSNASADPEFLLGWEAPDASRFSARTMSQNTAAKIDLETRRIVDGALKRCEEELRRHRTLLDALAKELVEKETVGYSEMLELLEKKDKSLFKKLGKSNSRPATA